MRRIYKLFVLCMLLICQQYIVAQNYNLGKQKRSFAYNTLYTNQAINIQPSEKTNSPTNVTEQLNLERENAEQEYNMIVSKLNRYGWQKSLLYSSYEKAFKYLIENNKIDDAKKVNRVLQDVLDNKIFNSNNNI